MSEAFILHLRANIIKLICISKQLSLVVSQAFYQHSSDIKTKSKTIKLLFGILLLAFSIYFFISQLSAQ